MTKEKVIECVKYQTDKMKEMMAKMKGRGEQTEENDMEMMIEVMTDQFKMGDEMFETLGVEMEEFESNMPHF